MNQKLKTYKKVTLVISSILLFLYFFIYRGDNRITIWLHHGIWLPPTTTNIDFYTYPGILAHLVNLDDWAKAEFDLPKSALANLLKNHEYQFISHIDSAENGLSWAYHMSGYRPVPDSIINGQLPFNLELKSTRGDFLIFKAKEKNKDLISVYLYTDWN
jgi:hypothetical protein